MKRTVLVLLFTLCFIAVAAEGQQMVFPREAWERASPEAAGVDPARLAEAIAWLERNTPRDGVRELAIVRNGRLIHTGPNVEKVHGIWSGTKSFTSTVLGLLIDDGKCTLDTRAAEYLPSMKKDYPGVTLRHFTTMTSGYRAVGDEPQGDYTHGPSKTPFTPGPPLFKPGAAYAYWDSAMNQFGNVLTRIAGEPMEALFRRRIAEPIQMDPAQWRWGNLGEVDGLLVNGGSGNGDRHIFISALQMARFGHLYLNKGRWNGRQLISAGWVEQATRTQVPATLPSGHPEGRIRGTGAYGFNWWANGVQPDGTRKWPGAPEDTFAASGHNNNKLFVIPSWGMVIVRLGLDNAGAKGFAVPDAVWGEFLRKVGDSLGKVTRAEAMEVHRATLLIDAHNDVPLKTLAGFDIGPRAADGHTDLARLREGGVGAVFFAAYVAPGFVKERQAANRVLQMIDTIRQDIVLRYPEGFAPAASAGEIEAARRQGKIAALIGVEGGHAIENSLRVLRSLYALGARYMTLTHSNTNDWADSSGDAARHNGLNDLGRDVIREMNRLGMLVDVSHVSDKTFWDVLAASSAPVFATHSSARALCNVPRNLTDEMIRALAKNGGVVAINFSCDYLSQKTADAVAAFRIYARWGELQKKYAADPERLRAEIARLRAEMRAKVPRATLADVVAHIDHVVKVAGIDHVAIGSDFDGISCTPEGLDDVSKYPNLTHALLERGYSAGDIGKIYSGNILRLMRAAQAAR